MSKLRVNSWNKIGQDEDKAIIEMFGKAKQLAQVTSAYLSEEDKKKITTDTTRSEFNALTKKVSKKVFEQNNSVSHAVFYEIYTASLFADVVYNLLTDANKYIDAMHYQYDLKRYYSNLKKNAEAMRYSCLRLAGNELQKSVGNLHKIMDVKIGEDIEVFEGLMNYSDAIRSMVLNLIDKMMTSHFWVNMATLHEFLKLIPGADVVPYEKIDYEEHLAVLNIPYVEINKAIAGALEIDGLKAELDRRGYRIVRKPIKQNKKEE